MERVIIVGGGLAGLRTAETLRAQGYAGGLTLVGAEPHAPYDRPPLSKAVLRGETDDTTVAADFDALGCATLLGRRATGLGEELETTEGPLAFDGLVIATGATPIRLPGDGPQHVLRTIDDARALRAALRPGARLVIVGAGWIGAEVATAAAAAGCRVTVAEAADAPLAGAVGAEAGTRTARWYAEAGVELRHGVKAASVEAGGLALAGGGSIEADLVLTGVGVRPETGWLEGSGLALENGVVVDEGLRTSRPGVFAVGDCAAWWSGRFGRRLRVEHWDVALNAPDVVAANLLGGERAYDAVPYFWSEQFGRMVQYAGHHPAADTTVWREDPEADRWSLCWLAGERLVAILTVDRPRDLVQGRRLIASGAAVDAGRLADPQIPVKATVRG
ncbi:NAD(P)/FAD-dependent oxidoreductase [Actinoallomurus iriomotensis]|uniref:Oxidoreductase n=1 Tax=Actinoallomurus iriomotensis TaxID=478107 RepID=A0A9W6VMZ6_9ACTN|nr:FAD-dependent oxidoreductase [Actinoallomurus iriomotensis]GLY72051.1 oxidoreductase [Actinoallomurus iriomotensis]